MESRKTFGGFFKEKRMSLGLTLRQFCEKHKLDAGNISRIERGVSPAPKADEILRKHAKFLHLKEASDDWYLFFDLAASEAGKLPKELMEKELIARMPVLFRTLRGKRLSKDKFDKLIKLIADS
jgi:transcriptional regulator with XRE-family HTH domain